MIKPTLFLDRDGTILLEPNDYKIDSFEKLRFLPSVISSLSTLKEAGYQLVMVSNQEEVGTESFSWEKFLAVHNLMLDILFHEGITFEEVLIDTHHAHENHPNRKPEIGMISPWLKQNPVDMTRSFVIGDRKTDAHLALNLGCQSITIKCSASANGDYELQNYPDYPTTTFDHWKQITRFLLEKLT